MLENLISSEIYLIKTKDKSFDLRKNEENIFSYIDYDLSGCGNNTVTYSRKALSIEEFRKYVPRIVQNMKETLVYSYFINHKEKEYDVYPFNFSPSSLAEFANKEQKNVQLVKINNNYICVSIKY
ncbi:hypothetical protein EDC46_1563 [Vespertiliibacter pulmonis]|uniref:Uncharacterized protein n=1 Tax=Vespertiliibacter pulmonis TaxID=1443036 RepID=A0A3N4VHU7_9PAST|nr:hypothetical protein [Vespertiliibacter pulmonis]RPE82626.1 hypothetical protein EDC46_1563 [Vespertiliibacter pulmonis]